MENLLEQTGPVNDLLQISIDSLEYIENDKIRAQLLIAIQKFSQIICPSYIALDEVSDLALKYQANIPAAQALSILEIAAYDIDTNYTGQAVEYHFDEYLASTLS